MKNEQISLNPSLTRGTLKPNFIGYILIVLAIIGLLFLSPLIFGFGKSGSEAEVLGKNYSLLSKSEIETKLKNDFSFDRDINLVDKDRIFNIKLSSISAQIDESKMASTILYRRLNLGLSNYIKAFFEKKDFELEVNWNKAELETEINLIAEQIDRPFIPTELIIDKGIIKIKDGELGVEVDKIQLTNQIENILKKYLVDNGLAIPINIIGILPSEIEKNKALDLAKKVINKKVIFKWDNKGDEITSETLMGFVGFENNCNTNKIAQFVANFNNSIKQEPRDAQFKFENNKVTQFEASKDGFVIDQSKMRLNICNNLVKWADMPSETNYDLPLVLSKAKISTSDVNDMGINELIGRGTSSFRHSSEIRNWNVQKGAEIVNRILVAPGETFSFIKNLGDVSLDNGFKKAYVINKGKTVLDVGGGICQVSTTLFRAMLNAGLNITDRKGHAYRVGYYEEDSKPGFDATVFIPNPDLKFVNDTGKYVLIQSFYDGVKKTLAYEIYGTKDGREVEIANYKQWDASPAPPDVWIDDPTLKPGQIVKDESKVPGLKTSFDWKVTRNGEILHKKTYVTNYVPWAAVYRRGPQI